MVEKIFRIMSNSEEHLSAENIAMALARQITHNSAEPDAAFAVMEFTEAGKEACRIQ